MAIIAKLRTSGVRVAVIGTGYGAFESARPSRVFGNLIPSYQSGRLGMIAVATKDGEVSWCPSHEVQIIEIDGIAIDQLMSGNDFGETPADLDFPATIKEEIHLHPQFSAFLKDYPDARFLGVLSLAIEFKNWQSERNGNQDKLATDGP